MGMRQREWARRKRAMLLEALGLVCAYCGATEDLTLDCIEPRGHRHHRLFDASRRATFYVREFRAGNLQVLCASCNARKGDARPSEVPELLPGLNPF